MPIGKPKEPKAPKAPKEKKPKKPKKEKPPKGKKLKKGQEAPEGIEGQEGEEQPKKKKFPILLLIPVVLAVAAAVFFFFIRPRMGADSDPDVSASVSPEPQPPVLPTQLVLDEGLSIAGMALDSDESGALVERTKTVTYTYTNLNNAGKAAETYASQLASKESPAFTLVDEDFVRIREAADYTTAEGMVLLARNVPVTAPAATPTPAPEVTVSLDPEASPAPTPTPEPEPTPEPVTYVHTVRITWSPGVCVVTASEEEGKVTSSPNSGSPAQSISLWDAQDRLESMDPAQLGLAGASMDEYEIIPMDGTQLVNGKACICMYVYGSNNAAHSNEYMGSYLMSLDGQHLYRLDPVTNQVTELEYSPK